MASAGVAELMPGFQRCVDAVNTAQARSGFCEFSVDGHTLGYLTPEFVSLLADYGDVFKVELGRDGQSEVSLAPDMKTCEARTKRVGAVMQQLREREGVLQGWRDELFPVSPTFSSDPALLLERAAVPAFGIKAYGVHVNGYVERSDGTLHMWVARRSKTKQTWPGMLDHIVAGGQPHGISPRENVVKECFEEAGVPGAMAAQAVASGVVSYEYVGEEGLKRDVLFVYDLRLPEDFVPEPQDGEVEEFFLWPVQRVMQVVAEGKEYKPNCTLVILDFLLRRGFITPEQPGYLQLLTSLRQGDCS